MSINTRVRATSETVMDDVKVQHQRYRTRLVHEVTREIDVPTSLTPVPSYLFRFYFVGCVKEVTLNLLQPQTERGDSASTGTVAPTHETKKVCQRPVDQTSSL